MLVVQKYGGSSVGDLEKISDVAKKVAKRSSTGDSIVVVVSAMRGETDKLIEYAQHFSKIPNRREMDMLLSSGERVTSSLLAIALCELGCDAISLSGAQAGILTNESHTTARIDSIKDEKILNHINRGKIVVVAGFQGVTKEGNISTLGRGGSDLSAVAIAAAIKADFCEIYSDVDGVYTTDPRIEPKAKKIDAISYEEMLEFASMGAKVLQNRSVELAMKEGVVLRALSTFDENGVGTLITKEENIMEKPLVSGIALDKNQARITLRDVTDRVGVAASIFEELAKEEINVDMILQNVGLDNLTNLGFTVPQNELERAKEVVEKLNPAKDIDYDSKIVKLSVIGVGMKSHSGVASLAFSTLAKENINIQMISTSEIKLSLVIDSKYGELALRALHSAYGLDA